MGPFRLLLLLAVSISAEGYLHFLKMGEDRSKGSFCYTNETTRGVAFVRKLVDYFELPQSKETKYQPISSKGYKGQDSSNCDPSRDCTAWSLDGFYTRSNLFASYDFLPPVYDRRWNGFKEFITDGKFVYEKMYDLGLNTIGKFHTSVLAREGFQFLFTDSPDLKNGYMIVVDGWKNLQGDRTVVRYCHKIPKDDFPSCSIPSDNFFNNNFLKGASEWTDIRIDFDFRYSPFVVELSFGNGSRNISTKFSPSPSNREWIIAIRSYRAPAILKLHQYKVFESNRNDAELYTEVDIATGQSICVHAPVHAIGQQQPNVQLQVENIETNFVAANSRLETWNSQWSELRVKTEPLIPGRYKVTLKTSAPGVFVGGVFFCTTSADVVETADTDVVGCHFVGGRDESSQTSLDNGLTKYEANTLCTKILSNDCNGVEYLADPLLNYQSRCLSGHTRADKNRPCDVRCKYPKFGEECKNDLMNAKCNDGYNIHTGRCSAGCRPLYKTPKCTRKILYFESAPRALSVGAYSANLTLFEATQTLKENDGVDQLKLAQIQLRKANSESPDWTTVFTAHDLSVLDEISISDLTPRSHYEVRAIVVEKDDESIPAENLEVLQMDTLPCTSLDSSNTKIYLTNELRLKVEPLIDDPNLCRLKSVKVGVNNFGRGPSSGRAYEEVEVDHQFPRPEEDTVIQIIVDGDDGTQALFDVPINAGVDSDIVFISIGVIAVLLIVAVAVTCVLVRKKRQLRESARSRTPEQEVLTPTNGVQLDLVPLPERRISNDTQNKSNKAVKVAELSRYVENAFKTDLFKEQHKMLPRGQTQPWLVGFDPANKKKNRYGNLAAYDATRVVLGKLPGDEESDYINANYIDGYKRPKAYIATQGPKPQTVHDFWRMVWQEEVSVIVMVANVIENEKVKCEKYWPDLHQSVTFVDYTISTFKEEVLPDYIVRSFWVSHTPSGDKRKVTHMHFTTWPDHGVPLYPISVADFAKRVISVPSQAPVVVHCSAGVGRTGTIILIDACLRMATAEGFVDVLGLLTKMRDQRANLVDNHQQYEFVHLVLLESLLVPLFSVPCNNFQNTYKELLANGKAKLAQQFIQVDEICEKEFARSQETPEIEDELCRFPAIRAAASQLVKIYPHAMEESVQFINAVYVDGFRKKNRFIATQVPMANTVGHFWRMIQQHNTQQVLILDETPSQEMRYLPRKAETLIFGDMKVTLLQQDQNKHGYVLTCAILLSGGQQCRVDVICVSGWSQDNPSAVESLVDLWEDVGSGWEDTYGVVVCYDGATSCGLFLAVGFVLEKMKQEQQVDAALATRVLRSARPKFVATQDQYEALHLAALVYLQAFETYGNFQ